LILIFNSNITSSIKEYESREKISQFLSPGSNRALFVENHEEKIFRANEKGKVLYAVLEEKVISDGLGYSLEANEFLFKHYNEKVTQLVEAGIAKYIDDKEQEKIIRKVTNFTVHKKKMKVDHKIVLNFEHLGIWFRIFLLLLGTASTVFLSEWIVGMSEVFWKTRKIIDESKTHSAKKTTRNVTEKSKSTRIKTPTKNKHDEKEKNLENFQEKNKQKNHSRSYKNKVA
jgi:hypothetical protein